jgi:hypothetical protein
MYYVYINALYIQCFPFFVAIYCSVYLGYGYILIHVLVVIAVQYTYTMYITMKNALLKYILNMLEACSTQYDQLLTKIIRGMYRSNICKWLRVPGTNLLSVNTPVVLCTCFKYCAYWKCVRICMCGHSFIQCNADRLQSDITSAACMVPHVYACGAVPCILGTAVHVLAYSECSNLGYPPGTSLYTRSGQRVRRQ